MQQRNWAARLAVVGTLALASMVAGPPVRADYYDGLRAFDGGNIQGAIAEWRSAGVRGDVLSQKRLGDVYAQGRVVLQDFVEAHMWYNLAAVNLLQNSLDERGRPVPEARKARDDARDARNRLQSIMTADDIDRARRKFVRVYEAGEPESQYILGGLYQRGAGVPQNSVEAYRYFVIASALGVQEALRARDILAANLKPEQVAAAQKAAKEWRKPLSPFEDEIGTGGRPGGGQLVAGIDNRSLQHALRALGLYGGAIDGEIGPGSRRAIERFQRRLGASETGRLTMEQAVQLIRRAATDEDDRASQNTLGSLYAQGIGVERDSGLARRWFEASAAQGFPSANYNLGLMYRDGFGVERDRDRAIRYFRRALQGGHPLAARALRDLVAYSGEN
ncbi:MAG: SEL1-like repeat protein [Alphaproteobacteria bacterium]|nr:SEL1-like repeat protein [Alphaproteobacteria bacterium]